MEKNRRAGNFLWTTRFHVLIGIIAGNMRKITQETIAGYCMTDNCEKLRKRFENGETNMSVEYCAREDDGSIRWVQKTVLMTRMVVFDTEILAEVPMIYAIILLQDTTQRHERDEQEQARLQ